MGHFIHACRRNLNITYIVFNNENYALTTGQASPTTPLGIITKTTPGGNHLSPIDPILLAQNSGCTFAKRAQSRKFNELKEIIKEAILHPGFALIDVDQDCPSFRRWAQAEQ